MADTAITKDEVVSKVSENVAFLGRAILFLDERQEEIERATSSTIFKNRRGLSVPLARVGHDLADTIREQGYLSWEGLASAVDVASYHWRQVGMLMLMEMGLDVHEAYSAMYPVKTPRRAPRARGHREFNEASFREAVVSWAEVDIAQAQSAQAIERAHAARSWLAPRALSA